MSKETENLKIKRAMSIASFVMACLLTVLSLLLPPMGVIDTSALFALAQFLILCSTLLEVKGFMDWMSRQKPNT